MSEDTINLLAWIAHSGAITLSSPVPIRIDPLDVAVWQAIPDWRQWSVGENEHGVCMHQTHRAVESGPAATPLREARIAIADIGAGCEESLRAAMRGMG